MLNKTPIDSHSKKQSKVETATHGLEKSLPRTCVEQILHLHITLWCLGVPISKLSHTVGDNDSVVNSSVTPQGNNHKIHSTLSFHRVSEAIAAKIISYQFISGKINPADILSKHWDHHFAWPYFETSFVLERRHYGLSR